MKVAIIGGGISGLSTAYYLKKFALPISEILLFESSSRFGGWIDSKKVQINNEEVIFEKGPRTLRLATGELKELNSIQLAEELGLSESVQLVSKKHIAATHRYLYFNNRIVPVKMKMFGKSDILSQGMIKYGYNEFFLPKRNASVEDESIWSFIERRFNAKIADNLVDPIFKGIVAGNVKNLSAASLLKAFWNYEEKYGSIGRGIFSNINTNNDEKGFEDLVSLRKNINNLSVWRLKNGMEELVEKLVEKLSNEQNVRLYLNEPIEKVNFDNENPNKAIQIKSKSFQEDVDLVISSVYSKYNKNFLPDKYSKLKNLFDKIDCVDVALINFYFKEDVLPVKGFGYLVPSNQDSPILGCIFDSVFNNPTQKSSIITVMMGGAWYDHYIGNKDSNGIYQLAYDEIKKHLGLKVNPDHYDLSVLKNAIPQYKVGHQKILKNINDCLVEDKLDDKFYVTGFSYEGVGINDCLFNSRKLVQNVLAQNRKFLK